MVKQILEANVYPTEDGRQEFYNAFSEAFQDAPIETYGLAKYSSLSFRIVLQAAREIMLSTPGFRKLERKVQVELLVNHLRSKVSYLEGSGLDYSKLIPSITSNQLAESAILHACGVAEHLVNERVVEEPIDAFQNAVDTFVSYSLKNHFDHWAEGVIATNNPQLLGSFNEPIDRDTEVEAKINYPVGVDNNNVYGVAKPLRYLPAQLTKNVVLKFLELSLDAETPLFYMWEDAYTQAISEAQDMHEYAVNIFMKTLPHLMQSHMSEDEIVEFLAASYSPSGMIREHGGPVIKDLFDLWADIFGRMEKTNYYATVVGHLKPLIIVKFASVGIIFR